MIGEQTMFGYGHDKAHRAEARQQLADAQGALFDTGTDSEPAPAEIDGQLSMGTDSAARCCCGRPADAHPWSKGLGACNGCSVCMVTSQ